MSKDKTKDERAIELVNQKIAYRRAMLKSFTELKDDAEPDPVFVDAQTATGQCCQLMVDPRDIAPILLKYDYPMYDVLGEVGPNEMWQELAQKFGVGIVISFDL